MTEASPTENFIFEIFAIWAGRVLNDVEYAVTPRIYSIDQALFEKELQYELIKVPLYSQLRVMWADDGLGSLTGSVGGIIKQGKELYDTGKEVWSGLKKGYDLVTDVADRVGSVFSSVFSLFGTEERVLRRLSGLTRPELVLALRVLTESECRPTFITNAVASAHFQRHRRRARSGRTPYDFPEFETCESGTMPQQLRTIPEDTEGVFVDVAVAAAPPTAQLRAGRK
jgi:hypothetical protein